MTTPRVSSGVAEQLRLELSRLPSHRREDFVVSASNRDAVEALEAWPKWPGGRLALIGPEGSGKTHLARMWAKRAGAVVFDADRPALADLADRPILLEDADRLGDDETLFHLFNRAGAESSLLLTARTPPLGWPSRLPDLRSRLNGLAMTQIEAADDTVLESVLRKLFRERNIVPADDVTAYLISRIERSVPAALKAVSRLDEVAAAEGRNVTRILARRIFKNENNTIDLFE